MNQTMTTSFAAAAAALFLAGCGGQSSGSEGATSADKAAASANVKCLGVNECKGKGECGVPGGHSCAGQNECKGKGWILLPKAECDAKGGSVQS